MFMEGKKVIKMRLLTKRKLPVIAALVSILHFFEDALLIILGRYTELNIFILFIATIAFGIAIAAIARISFVRKWLGK
tara:strand:- start:868 stop:1101 length:234 start_codon:yes stop_codon:yes gene_type:complete